LNLTDNPVFGKKYPQFSRAVIGRFRTGLRPVPLAKDEQAPSPPFF
jgi:hypothetical protein